MTSEERHIIEVRFNEDKWSIYRIAKSLGRPYNTIKNEVNRGMVYLYNGKVARYKADKGEKVYLNIARTVAAITVALKQLNFSDMLKVSFLMRNGRWMQP